MMKIEHVDINLHPLESYSKNKYKNLDEKNELVDLIIDDIKDWKKACSQLDREDNYLGSFCITNCDSCFQWYLKMCENYSEEFDGESMKWSVFFNEYEKFNYTCGSECKLIKLNEKLKKEYMDKQHNRKEKLKIVQELQIGYRVALEQQKNLSKQLNDAIQAYKEKNAILIFKKKSLQYIINCIQISIILVSSIITFFEAIQSTIFKNDTHNIAITVFPIVLSTYIGLILAIGRFFKFDTKNEQIIKLIEKYSFIINKLRQKRSKYMDFDFKIHNVSEWNNLLSIMEKDSIDDIIMKANEECDLILTPKQYTHYKKKYTKTRMKDLLERKNYDELSDIIIHNSGETRQKNITMHMIKKRNFCKYYFCCLWICMDRDYVDYNDVLVRNRNEFFDVEKCTNNRIRRRREPRMRVLARNISNINREFRNNSPKHTGLYYNNANQNSLQKLNENSINKNLVHKNDSQINNNLNQREQDKKNKKEVSPGRKYGQYNSTALNKKERKMNLYKKRNKSFSRNCDNNAWLDLQKSKGRDITTRKVSRCDFSTIRDSSKNGVFKKNSNNSSNSSSDNESETEAVLALKDIAPPMVLDISNNISLNINDK